MVKGEAKFLVGGDGQSATDNMSRLGNVFTVIPACYALAFL